MIPAMSDLFEGFQTAMLPGDGAEIFLRHGGSGPPLLLLHGYPQTHMMWAPVASLLAERFSVVAMDLRGYGRSSCPENDAENEAYSKRVMARDAVAVMSALGHESFFIAGHDRGGRVAYRLALDHPQRVGRLALLDIVSTEDTWQAFDPEFALATYHWPFLAQPYPLPETLIGGDPIFYLNQKIASWSSTGDLSPFNETALADYRNCFSQPEHLHASCNDYRAGATYDRKADQADLAAGRKIECPMLVLYGEHGIPSKTARGPARAWQRWCDNLETHPVASGHFPVEENPVDTLAHLMRFFGATGA